MSIPYSTTYCGDHSISEYKDCLQYFLQLHIIPVFCYTINYLNSLLLMGIFKSLMFKKYLDSCSASFPPFCGVVFALGSGGFRGVFFICEV